MLNNSSEIDVQEGLKTFACLQFLLHKCKSVTSTKPILKEEGTSKAHELTFRHNSDSISEHICFVHVMSSQNYDTAFLVLHKHIPEVSSGTKVHSRGWLIEEHGFKGDGEAPPLTDDIRITLSERYLTAHKYIVGEDFDAQVGNVAERIEANLKKAGLL